MCKHTHTHRALRAGIRLHVKAQQRVWGGPGKDRGVPAGKDPGRDRAGREVSAGLGLPVIASGFWVPGTLKKEPYAEEHVRFGSRILKIMRKGLAGPEELEKCPEHPSAFGSFPRKRRFQITSEPHAELAGVGATRSGGASPPPVFKGLARPAGWASQQGGGHLGPGRTQRAPAAGVRGRQTGPAQQRGPRAGATRGAGFTRERMFN